MYGNQETYTVTQKCRLYLAASFVPYGGLIVGWGNE